MFKRVILEEWHNIVPYICFALTAGVFITIVVRTILMKRSDVDRLARIPLEDTNSNSDEATKNSDRP